MAKEARASWFKLFLHQKPMMDAVPDEVLGRAIKGAMAYCEKGEEAPLDTVEQLLFLMFKPYIDEAQADFQKKAENGKKGGRPKKQTKPEVISENQTQASLTEAEADADADAEADADADANAEESVCNQPGKPAHTRFVPPDVNEVSDYCRQKGYHLDARRFVDYYTAVGWRIGNTPMRDWKAAIRNWHRKDDTPKETEPKFTWTVGHVL